MLALELLRWPNSFKDVCWVLENERVRYLAFSQNYSRVDLHISTERHNVVLSTFVGNHAMHDIVEAAT